jgi:AraC-like DNA-binding protein
VSIAVFLPPHQLAHVRHVFVAEDEFFVADSWKNLEELIRVEPVTVAIIDPAADGTMRVDAAAALLGRFPSLPCVGYVPLNAVSFGAIAQLSRRGLQHVVLHRFDDSRERLLQTISRVNANPPSQRMLALLEPTLQQIPLALARAIKDMFERPHRYGSVFDLAESANLPPVGVYRSLEHAGISTPKKLLMVAKLTRGLTYLRDPGYTVREVALKLGYKHARILNSHSIEVFKVTPARVRSRLSDDDAIAMLTRWIDLPDSAVKPRKRWASR